MPGPYNVAGCKLWLAADRLLDKWTPARLNPGGWYSAGSLTEASGTTPTRWRDLSGNGRHLTTIIGATLQRNVVNGRSVLRFDGIDDVAYGPASGLGGTDQPLSIFVVAKNTDGGGATRRVAAGIDSSASANPVSNLHLDNSGGRLIHDIRDDGGTNKSAVGTAIGSSAFRVLGLVHTGTVTSLYIDNLLSGTAAQDTNVGALTANQISIGASKRNSAAVQLWQGDIAEAIFVLGVLSDADRNRLMQYWGMAYGLTTPVGYWADLSGNGYHAVQNTDALKPLWQPNGLGAGLPSVLFDGTDDYMLAPVPSAAETEATFIGTFTRETAAVLRGVFSYTDTTNTRLTIHSQNTSGDVVDVNTGTGAGTYLESAASPGTGPIVVTSKVKTADATSELWINGTLRDSASGTPSILLGAGAGWAVGCRVPGSGAQPYKGHYGEAMAFNVAISSPNRAKLDAMQRRKWRVA